MDTVLTYNKYLTLLLVISIFSSGFYLAQPIRQVLSVKNSINDSGISEHKQAKYQKDATRLALRLMSSDADYADLKAAVPKDMVGSIYSALVAIHKSDLPKAAEVTQTHKLHTFPIPSVDQFFVIYEKTADWSHPLRLGGNTTDNVAINKLLEDYNLKIDKHMEWDEDHNSFNVRAQEAWNMAPIAQLFSNMDNVILVDLLVPDGDGNDIEIKKLEDGWELNYHVKFDTCITGCKQKHVWTFEVRGNEVHFMKEWGDKLPKWMKSHG